MKLCYITGVTPKNLSSGHSSEVLNNVLGDIGKYIQIAKVSAQLISEKYPSPNLAPVFTIIPRKLITICPMALFDDITQDLGKTCDDQILEAIGLSCLSITTHDDVVDETPTKRPELAALIYAGNIATLEGIRLLYKNHPEVANTMVSLLNENHYYQQFRIDLLWENKPENFDKYIEGIKDVVSLAKIGPLCALVFTNQAELRDKIDSFATGFGLALQIIDDIREVEEDKISGYTSFPVIEGPPFSQSFSAINKYLKQADASLNSTWTKTRDRLGFLIRFTKQLEEKLS